MGRLKSNFLYDLVGKFNLMLYPYITLIPKKQLARQQEDPGHVDAYVALMLELKAKHLS